ncbi:hypothetical protein [Xanthocytophaga agilis]|uniref:Uncharacterized protein n=1 Tax=Xanthocytophaga agilis TaxID=3048010 RepID=A0AAE3R4D1_9BACT|nr:hypothetical protein [Xanthocytophaga agilis]MDJ1500452.1 hypothetical protein [Xanthocytophaga agilis]
MKNAVYLLFIASLGSMILAFVIEGVIGAQGAKGLWNWFERFFTVAPGSMSDVSTASKILVGISGAGAAILLVILIKAVIKSLSKKKND